ncbi:molybdate ABC transporter permease subunit [Sphingomonas jatrophae]|uniref:Molybdenum transport system permease n=1 Tax=Sphingomonas jatrophae TaxID=1166337 RepID=A0A1I6JM25_9SPHN|nr:molybdate ABC transporter permease subunit [Sphingomonas jatrophae]SFR79999.1 molybdate transport system permease protein [Sphingomonas jatrophae]
MSPDAAIWVIVALSLKVAAAATIVLLPVAWGLAWVLAHKRGRGVLLLDALIHLPLVLPPVVVGYVLLILFAPAGPLGRLLDAIGVKPPLFSWEGAAIASAVMALPLAVRSIRLSLEAIEPEVDESARLLGAGTLKRILRIALPLSLPGLLAAAVLAFARALGEFGATITFVAAVPGETLTLPLAIHAALQEPDGEPLAWRLSLFSAALSLGALIGADLIARRLRR